MADKGKKKNKKAGKEEGRRDELIRGLEYVRDLLNSVVPAVISVNELEQAKATTGALIQMRNAELSQAQAGA